MSAQFDDCVETTTDPATQQALFIGPWYRTTWFVGAARILGIAEMAGGLVLIVLRHDEAQGYALLAIGAATIGSMPWPTRAPSEERS